MTGQRKTLLSLPLSNRAWIHLEGSLPITETEYDRLLRILEVMKKAIVVPDDVQDQSND